MTILTTKTNQLALIDSLPQALQLLMGSSQIDWTGNLLGKTTRYLEKIPVIAKDSETYRQLTEAVKHFEAMMSPAQSQDIVIELSRLRLHFPMSSLNDKQISLVITDYLQDLGPYPIDLIKKACRDYRCKNDSGFFPKISELIKLIKPAYYERKCHLKRLRILLETADKGN